MNRFKVLGVAAFFWSLGNVFASGVIWPGFESYRGLSMVPGSPYVLLNDGLSQVAVVDTRTGQATATATLSGPGFKVSPAGGACLAGYGRDPDRRMRVTLARGLAQGRFDLQTGSVEGSAGFWTDVVRPFFTSDERYGLLLSRGYPDGQGVQGFVQALELAKMELAGKWEGKFDSLLLTRVNGVEACEAQTCLLSSHMETLPPSRPGGDLPVHSWLELRTVPDFKELKRVDLRSGFGAHGTSLLRTSASARSLLTLEREGSFLVSRSLKLRSLPSFEKRLSIEVSSRVGAVPMAVISTGADREDRFVTYSDQITELKVYDLKSWFKLPQSLGGIQPTKTNPVIGLQATAAGVRVFGLDRVQEWDLANRELVREWISPAPLRSWAGSEDGTRFVALLTTGELWVPEAL